LGSPIDGFWGEGEGVAPTLGPPEFGPIRYSP